jgi:long-chain acyl-CoA synthetase
MSDLNAPGAAGRPSNFSGVASSGAASRVAAQSGSRLEPAPSPAAVLAPSELPAFFRRIAGFPGEFVIYDDGFRTRTYSYGEIARLAGAVQRQLRTSGLEKGDRVVIWSESRPGWIVALWACLVEGLIVVPVDPQASPALFTRIYNRVHPRLVLRGERVSPIPEDIQAPVRHLTELERPADVAGPAPSERQILRDDIAEIVFTSGTTAEPKGVLITHGNLTANLKPVEDQVAPYRKYISWFAPVRILNLLPMSHLFGQALALFVPPLIPGSVVFISGGTAEEIARQIRKRRVVAVAAVPKVLEVMRDYVRYRFPETASAERLHGRWQRRWWRFRRVHWSFGWKFVGFVVGGAPLAPEPEQFWSRLAFLVVQGYGLTETAPIISFSHPFHVRPGTAGKPLEGIEVKIAEDGELLVRGPNVTSGYFESPEESAKALEGGWFHTGDIAEFDPEGHLIIRGRKKDLIVTPEGLNVFPEDVESVLNRISGVKESAVIGHDRVHAVLVLEPGADADAIVRQANEQLEDHQKIRAVSIWPGEALPRTSTTQKLQRALIAEQLRSGRAPAPAHGAETELIGILQKYAPGRKITPETTLDELGLSSLERVELMMELEQKLDASVDENVFTAAHRVADLTQPAPAAEPLRFPRYSRSAFFRWLRDTALTLIFLPLARFYAPARVSGLENLPALGRGPIMIAANHESHMDTPVILAALPRPWRKRIAAAMAKEYFDAHFQPEKHTWWDRLLYSFLYGIVTVLFNAFPIPQAGTQVRAAIRYIGELVDEGWSILIFPEGLRSEPGKISPFQPGVGMIASHLQLPVVPVRLHGVGHVLPPSKGWPRRRQVSVCFGKPILPPPASTPNSNSDFAQKVQAAVQAM